MTFQHTPAPSFLLSLLGLAHADSFAYRAPLYLLCLLYPPTLHLLALVTLH